MMTIVPTTDDQPPISVVRFTSELAWADAGPEVADEHVYRLCMEALECMASGRWLDLASLMLTSADLVFSNPKVSEKDLECIFTVICNLVIKPESVDEAHAIAKLICSKIVQNPTDKPALRLKILFNLYNMLEHAYSRFHVYLRVLELALSGKVTEHVISSVKKIDNFLKEWNLEVKDQRELFLTVSNILRESKSSGKESFRFLAKYLATFTGEDANAISESKGEAVRAVIEFVKASEIFQCDLLDLPAVAQLEKDASHSLIYLLLKIFLTQRLDAYIEFQAANADALKAYGLVHEDCITKMRLISLVDLASHESRQIAYDAIKGTLQINDDEVEFWIVKAITARLIDCKMDQMNRLVLVSRSADRVFGKQEWQALRTKLAVWRGNITNVIGTIQANKLPEDGSQAAIQGLAIR